jgi:cyanate permease
MTPGFPQDGRNGIRSVTAPRRAGALYAPLGSAAAWVLILGISQGAALALAIFFTIARAPDPVSAASLSSLAQAAGYLVASAGPLELGLLHSATGSWDLPVAVLFVLNGCLLAAGMLAGRPRVLPDGRNPPSAVIWRIPGATRLHPGWK